MNLWKVARALHNPNAITLNPKHTPWGGEGHLQNVFFHNLNLVVINI
jgi:hypothetical protein